MASDNHSSAWLKLEIAYFVGADARSAGLAIERLANAFMQHSRSQSGQLQIASVEIASLHALLEIGGAVSTLVDQRAVLGQFVSALAVALESVMNAGGAQIPASFRSLFSALATPIVRARASSAKIAVHGDNNTIVYIENLQPERIDELFGRTGDRGTLELSYAIKRNSSQDNPHSLDEKSKRRPPTPKSTVDIVREFLAAPQNPSVLSHYPKVPLDGIPRRVSATLIQVEGTWYARPADLRGTMVPVNHAASELKEGMNGTTIEGVLQFNGAIPVLFDVR